MVMKKRVAIVLLFLAGALFALALVGCEEPEPTGPHRDSPPTGTNSIR
jgi:hypothetical protein